MDNVDNPFRICFADHAADVSPEAALRALIAALADAGVKDATVFELAAQANQRHCKPPLPLHELDRIINFILLSSAQKRGLAMGPIDISTSEGREKLRQSKTMRAKMVDNPSVPLRAYVRATLEIRAWNPHTYELEATWHDDGRVVRLPIGNADPRQLQRAVGESLGSLGMYSRAAHQAAKPSHLIEVLWSRVKGLPRTDAGTEESHSMRLFWALYEANVFVVSNVGNRQVTRVTRLCDAPEVYPTMGVGITDVPKLGRCMVANLDKAAGAILRTHPDFGRMDVRELTLILQRAPGYSGRCRSRTHLYEKNGQQVETFRETRWHAVSLATEVITELRGVPSVPSEPTPGKQVEF